jgi:hypothetical protein
VTRARPKVDRVACPWMIRRFVDPHAMFLFVPAPEVAAVAARMGATPFDIEDDGARWTHDGELCTFDVMVEGFGLGVELGVVADVDDRGGSGRAEQADELIGGNRIYCRHDASSNGWDAMLQPVASWGDRKPHTPHKPDCARVCQAFAKGTFPDDRFARLNLWTFRLPVLVLSHVIRLRRGTPTNRPLSLPLKQAQSGLEPSRPRSSTLFHESRSCY